MGRHKFIILTALTMEAKALAAAFGVKLSPNRGPVELESGVELRIIGIGAKRLSTEWIQDAEGLILAGIAGGLDPALQVGDVVVDGPDTFVRVPIPGRRGKIVSAPKVICTRDDKQALFTQTSAAAVDMESDAVRQMVEATNVPLLIVRAISDAAEDEIPSALINWIDDFGKPKPRKVAFGIAINPTIVPTMIRVGKNSNFAARQMAIAVREIVGLLDGVTSRRC